jgi:hypothetical protein
MSTWALMFPAITYPSSLLITDQRQVLVKRDPSELDAKRCEKLVAAFIQRRRPPPHIRNKVDLAFRMLDQSVEIFEVRRHWRDESKVLEHAIAKATYNKSKRNWRVFWQRADLKWHGYKPNPKVDSIEDFLALVQKDEHGCFFG